ncbi:MAG: hypothetical protein J6X69_02985 [Bacteroidales bacterium]|nr:hypothetical protein [Bacteroidales bacterium]
MKVTPKPTYLPPRASERSLILGHTVLSVSVRVPGATITSADEEEWTVY